MKDFLRAHQTLLLTWTCGLLFALQILNLHSYVVLAVDHQAVVATNDDDAAWNISKTLKTRWWKDNGWVLYGPAYFRLNHSIQYFWGHTADPIPIGAEETWQRTAHHAILTVSLLSVAGTALVVARTMVSVWWMSFLLALALTSALLSSPTWCELLLRAHPDHLFTLVIVGALYLTLRMFERMSEPIWAKLAAILWGVSVSVKMTLTLCTPGFVLLFLPRFRQGWRFLGVMLLAYFLIGFPQTIVLDRPFRALAEINGLSAPPNSASMLHWLEVFGLQLWRPLLTLALASVCLTRARHQIPRASFLRVSAFVLLPFLLLLFKNMLVPADHYAIPFVAMFLLWSAYGLTLVGLRVSLRPVVRAVIFLAVMLAAWGSTPGAVQTQLTVRLACREPARVVYKKISDYSAAGEKVWVDPYVPYVTTGDEARMLLGWEKTWDYYEKGKWTVLALNRGYAQRFTEGSEPSAYTKIDIPKWNPVREFYSAFKGGDLARGPHGEVFYKVYQNDCQHEIWELAKPQAPFSQ